MELNIHQILFTTFVVELLDICVQVDSLATYPESNTQQIVIHPDNLKNMFTINNSSDVNIQLITSINVESHDCVTALFALKPCLYNHHMCYCFYCYATLRFEEKKSMHTHYEQFH